MLTGLMDRVGAYPNPRNVTVGLRLFTANSVPPITSDRFAAHWYSMQDLYD
jgi:hypothetical protein